MKKWLMAAAVAAAGFVGTDARAQGPAYVPGNGSCPNGDCAPGYGYAPPVQYGNKHSYSALSTHSAFGGLLGGGGGIARMPTLPVYMAAPWYLYWPYDGHFQTIAPMAQGLYYPPPMYTGNPYMPGQYPQYMSGNPHPTFPMAPVKP
jgi:hypothetical protein